MLRKLFKYEWKSVYKIGLILLGVVAFATLLGFLASRSPLWSDVRIYNEFVEGLTGVMSILSIFLFILLLTGTIYALFIYIAVRFYRSTYTDEGYLLHTLPVTKHQILVSKLLVSALWLLIVYAALVVAVVMFVMFMIEAVEPGSVGELMAHLPEAFGEIGKALSSLSGSERLEFTHFVISLCLNLLIGLPSGVLMIFCAVSLGQLFSKHRVLMAVLCYFGIAIVVSIISGVRQTFTYTGTLLYDFDQTLGYVFTVMDTTFVMNLLMAVGFYLLSYFIMSKKLNME